jgi:hypothetical protein
MLQPQIGKSGHALGAPTPWKEMAERRVNGYTPAPESSPDSLQPLPTAPNLSEPLRTPPSPLASSHNPL